MALTRATDKIIANADGNLNLSGIVTASSFVGPLSPANGHLNLSGIVTANKFVGDGSDLEGVSSSGIGTALNDDDTNVLNKIYYVNQELSIGSTVTVNHPDTGTASYTHYQDLVVKNDADFIVADGDTFIPDILGITTSTLAASAATGGRIRAGTITNAGANGAVNFPNGLTGTAGTFTGNLNVGGVLTYEDVTNVDSVGVITARSGIRIGATGANTLIQGTATGIALGTGTPRQKLHINASDSGASNMVFTNATTGTAAGDGFVIGITGGEDAQLNMQESANIKFSTADTERLRIGSAGQLGIGGANYGTSGQVITSQGSGSAVQWATPAAGWVHGTETALNGNVVLIKNGVPDGASHIRYLLRYVSCNSSAQPFCQVELNNNGTIKNSNFQTASTTTRGGSPQISGDSDKTDGLTLWNGYTNAGNILHGVLNIYRIGTNGTDGTNYYMEFHGMGNSSSSGYDATHSGQGYFELGTGSTDYVSGLRLSTGNGSVQFDNGYIQQSYLLS